MTKEQILEYAGKGDVEHNGFIINVIKKDFDNVLKDFIEIELKPINEYTDGPIHTAFLGYISDQDLIELENSLKKEFAIMKKQEEIMKKELLKLNQVKNISSNYEATFEDENKQKYVLIYENLQKIAYRLEMLDSNYTFHLRETILDKAEIIKYNNNELIEEIEDIAADYGVVLDDSEECESL